VANHFGDRLFDAVKSKKTPLIVGLDPVYNRLPAQIRTHEDMNDEFDIAAAVDAILDYCTRTLRIIAPLVPAVKINIAFFERYLWEGLESYYSLITEADDLGIELIGDVKRGDIGSTAEQYAKAHIANPEFEGLSDILAPDAITINGYAGSEGILPFADTANEQGKGIFVWVRASNPSAAMIQDMADANGVTLYERMAAVVAEIANDQARIGKHGYSNVGMIVGGTAASDCVQFCKPDGTGALISSSRSIIYAYENPKYTDRFGDNWEKCIEQAVIDAKVELAKAM
jgi:orotidine-5'-phosphate decarboxylase